MAGDVIAGKNPVLEALRAGRRIHRIHLAESAARDAAVHQILDLAEAAGVEVHAATPGRLDSLARGTPHQGVVAVAEALSYVTVEHLLDRARAAGEEPFVLLLDGVEDPHNLGAVLRVADGAGVHGVIIPERHAAGLGPGTYKASAGAAEHVPVARVANLMDGIQKLKRHEVWIGGAEADEGKTYWEERLTGPLGLVLGSEGRGLSNPVKKHCDFFVRIPLRGNVSSLNVSVAAAILVFERLRQASMRAKATRGASPAGRPETPR